MCSLHMETLNREKVNNSLAIEEDENQQQSKRTKVTHGAPTELDSTPILLPEIFTEILARLPVTSLLQCRCVCKSWRSLISDPKFVKSHHQISINNPNYANHRLIFSSTPKFNLKNCHLYPVLNDCSVNAVELDYPLKHPHKSVWIVGSCNGLLCIAIEEDILFLWNPATRKSTRLPYSGLKLRSGWYVIYGFGYVECDDDYKVVGIFCLFQNGGRYKTEVKVFSLKSGYWRRIGDFALGIPLDDSGKFANGVLHWAASRGFGSGSLYSWIIVSLDLAKESYGEVAQPVYDEGDFDLTLGVLGGCLCVLCNYRGTYADVWLMKEYNVRESWRKVVRIPYLADPGKYQFSVPLLISRNDEILMEYESQLILYDAKSNSFKHPDIGNFDSCLEAICYVESLVSPVVNNRLERSQ